MKQNPTQNLSNVNQHADDADAVTVSDIIGDGPSAHRIVRVGPSEFRAPPTLTKRSGLKVRDLDLAIRLEYSRPEKIRDLIRRMVADGKLKDVEVFTPAGKTSGGRPAREYWLTEAQALKVAAKSETSKADALLDEVIRVFFLALDRLLPQQQAEVAGLLAERSALQTTVDQQQALIVAQSHDLDMVRTENRTLREQQTNGTIPHASADWIRDQIAIIAPMMVALGWCPRKQTLRAAKRVLQNGIASAAGWGHEKGQEIAGMPISGFPHVRAYLRAQRTVMEAEVARRNREKKAAMQTLVLARQGNLFGDAGANLNAGRAVS